MPSDTWARKVIGMPIKEDPELAARNGRFPGEAERRPRQPALQNIPIRSDLGRQLRRTLLDQPSRLKLMVESDVSTLERRLLASLLRR